MSTPDWEILSFVRSEFEGEGLKNSRERLAHLEGVVKAEEATLVKLEHQKQAIQEEITASDGAIAEQREELTGIREVLDEKTKAVEQVKKTTTKASKVLDQALKEIASRVRSFI